MPKELSHIAGRLDARAIADLEEYYLRCAGELRTMRELRESDDRRAAELQRRAAAWRATLAPRRLDRARRIMRLYRRGFSDLEIGGRVELSDRQVRRIIRAERGCR